MLEGPRSVVAFLTTIPVGRSGGGLEKAAAWMPFFPAVGLLVGAVAGVSRLALGVFFPPIVSGAVTLGVLLTLTGVHHTDGLLDFGDGLMRRGSKEEKIAAMRDTSTGAGGFGMGFTVLLTTAAAMASLGSGGPPPVLALMSAEASAKAAMVVAASAGRSASPGMNSLFIDAMHGRYRKRILGTAAAVLFAAAVGFFASGPRGVVSVAAALLATLLIVRLSSSQFGGLTGDVFGATNDIARMASLLVMIAS